MKYILFLILLCLFLSCATRALRKGGSSTKGGDDPDKVFISKIVDGENIFDSKYDAMYIDMKDKGNEINVAIYTEKTAEEFSFKLFKRKAYLTEKAPFIYVLELIPTLCKLIQRQQEALELECLLEGRKVTLSLIRFDDDLYNLFPALGMYSEILQLVSFKERPKVQLNTIMDGFLLKTSKQYLKDVLLNGKSHLSDIIQKLKSFISFNLEDSLPRVILEKLLYEAIDPRNLVVPEYIITDPHKNTFKTIYENDLKVNYFELVDLMDKSKYINDDIFVAIDLFNLVDNHIGKYFHLYNETNDKRGLFIKNYLIYVYPVEILKLAKKTIQTNVFHLIKLLKEVIEQVYQKRSNEKSENELDTGRINIINKWLKVKFSLAYDPKDYNNLYSGQELSSYSHIFSILISYNDELYQTLITIYLKDPQQTTLKEDILRIRRIPELN
jgi:hypothetical protein